MNPVTLSFFNHLLEFVIYTLLPFGFILAFCISIHEFGHFLLAKLFRIPVEKFSIGFGPPVFRRRIGETDFRIAYLPLGGYVKMAGEDEGEILKPQSSDQEPKTTLPGFYDAPIYRRILVVFGGPLFNIIAAFFVIVITVAVFGLSINPYTRIEVADNSYAHRAGLLDGDSIISVDQKRINHWDEFMDLVAAHKGRDITITIIRHGSEISKVLQADIDSLGLTPLVPPILGTVKRGGPAFAAGMKIGDKVLRIDSKEISTWYEMVDIVRTSRGTRLSFDWQHEGEPRQGIIEPASFYDPVAQDTVGQIGVFMPVSHERLALLNIIDFSAKRTGAMIWLTLKTLYGLVTRQISMRAIGGPIAIAKITGESAQWGFEYLFGLLAIISINLALINLFPIPALDGGLILISLIEALRRRRFSRRTRLIVQQIGYAIILILIVLVTFNDITR